MSTEQENNLMETASRNNSWVWLYPAVREHLIAFFSDIRQEYFTNADGVVKDNYRHFFADILQAHNDLYVDSLPCVALCNNDNLREHQKAVKRFRMIGSYLREGGDIHFKLQGWRKGKYEGLNIISIRVENVQKTRSEKIVFGNSKLNPQANISERPELPTKLGFDSLPIMVTDLSISKDDPRYNKIRNVLLNELAELEGEGNNTWRAPINAFAVQCRGLNETIKKYLPESLKKDRADIIMKLFHFYCDPSDFAEILDPLQKNE